MARCQRFVAGISIVAVAVVTIQSLILQYRHNKQDSSLMATEVKPQHSLHSEPPADFVKGKSAFEIEVNSSMPDM
jgi:hypothetical protein